MNKKVTLVSPFDSNKRVTFLAANSTIRNFREGKCWSVFCNNPIYFVHLSKKGIASHGYCYGCTHMHIYEYRLKELPKERGIWASIYYGRLDPWFFDEVTKSFKPLKTAGGTEISAVTHACDKTAATENNYTNLKC